MAHADETHNLSTMYSNEMSEAIPMKKFTSILSILLVLAVLLSACAGEPEPTTIPTTVPTTTPMLDAADVPLSVKEFYIEFLEVAKTDRYTATMEYCHFEDRNKRDLTAAAPNLMEYEIIDWECLSNNLWAVEVKQTDVIYPHGCYGMNYIGKIDGKYYVMIGIGQIPSSLSVGVNIEPYEPWGEDIVDPNDIIGPIT